MYLLLKIDHMEDLRMEATKKNRRCGAFMARFR